MKKRRFHSVILDDFCEAFADLKRLRRAVESKRVLFDNNMRKINALVSSEAAVKVEFGAGENRGLEGWTYVDKVHNCDLVLDMTQPLLFPDNSVDEIYSSHLLEHLTYRELICFLGECLRILVSGGKFGAAVPNARLFLQTYCDHDATDIKGMCGHTQALNGTSRIDYVNYIAYMDGFHRYMFDEDNLVETVAAAGFRNTSIRDFDETIDLKERLTTSIYVHAEK